MKTGDRAVMKPVAILIRRSTATGCFWESWKTFDTVEEAEEEWRSKISHRGITAWTWIGPTPEAKKMLARRSELHARRVTSEVMMGARVSTGKNSKQDYRTPDDLFAACEKRFGPVVFDLAAHAGNARHARYFAPCTSSEGPEPFDPEAYGIDAFDHDWTKLYWELELERNGRLDLHPPVFGGYPKPRPSMLWLNPPFDDIPRWAEKCVQSTLSKPGAHILFLTPAAVGSNWFRNIVAPNADVYLLNGRPAFIAGKSYNKDCMVSHFGPHPASHIHIWDWRSDEIIVTWKR